MNQVGSSQLMKTRNVRVPGSIGDPCLPPGQVTIPIVSQLENTYGTKEPVERIQDPRVQHLRNVYCFGKEIEIPNPSSTLGAKWKEIVLGDDKKCFQLMKNRSAASQVLTFDSVSKIVTLKSATSTLGPFYAKQTITQDAEGTITHS